MGAPAESLTGDAQRDAQSARTYALVGFLFFAIMAGIWSLVVLASGLSAFTSRPFGAGPAYWIAPVILPFGVFLGLSIGFAAWGWGILKEIDRGGFARAQNSSLVLGILGLFPPIGAVVAGVFYLLAYYKLGVVLAPAREPALAAPMGRMCPACGRAVPLDAKFCLHCGKELPG